MSDGGPSSLIAWIDAMLGGAATTIIAALTMRLIYHNQEVRRNRRRMFGVELLWEAPIAVGMALMGDALSSHLGLSHSVAIGVVGVMSWLGPVGAQTLLDRWLLRNIGGDK